MKKWVDAFFACTESFRKQVVKDSIEAVRHFIKGEPSEQGEKCASYLESKDLSLIGVCYSINYIKVSSPHKDELEVEWKHDFSIPTLLYHVKGCPFLLLANANLDYNKSRLSEIPGNVELEDIKNLRGIQG